MKRRWAQRADRVSHLLPAIGSRNRPSYQSTGQYSTIVLRRHYIGVARWIFLPLAYPDHLWSYLVMKQVGIAELKSKLSEFLRVVQGGESIAVLDRNRAVAHIVPILERPGLRIRKPASDSPKPNKVSLPKPTHQKFDVLELLLEERQSHR